MNRRDMLAALGAGGLLTAGRVAGAADRPDTEPPRAPSSLEGQKGPSESAPVEAQNRQPEPQPIELSGRLRRPVKWTPQLELIPAGQIKRFDLQGNLLRDIKEGTFLRVRGVVRSRLHRGGTKDDPSPFPAQWIIWLEVTFVEVLDDPRDVLKKNDKN